MAHSFRSGLSKLQQESVRVVALGVAGGKIGVREAVAIVNNMKYVAMQRESLRNAEKKVLFDKHLELFINMFSPETGVTLATALRYKTERAEAKVISTRHWNTDDIVTNFMGVIAEVPKDVEDDFFVCFMSTWWGQYQLRVE
ncbi:hypothetical protein SARC_14612 [Sphaeroforma arctica JP610]|uniref:Uncharacterized protein n=1 Tax=Sphaeroforma arctica JP610 TaxID=667725 RepID=A0A0L0F9N8_9EUKA|nr:hypothetical protein SARC_14612 [Sphaeroforma arctica JP610]KNC72828.1 hypothetical protein SARC_14612 [Sphaeroforma arctica JP610]|eukprot:XP_014146730.1 hypothetical protein SARC_14612 [Sphaeroforma arctica JP610]